MDEDVPTTTQDTDLTEVARLMVEEGARRVPVVDGELEGIVTITDVIRAIAREKVETDAVVGDVATRDVNTTYTGTPLPVVERELYYANVPYAVVLDDDAGPAGMITEVDIVAGEEDTGESIANQDDEWAWEGIKAVGGRYLPTRNVEVPATSVSEFMTEDLITVSAKKTVVEAAQLMISNDIEQIPMFSGEPLVGIVRDIDLLEALYD